MSFWGGNSGLNMFAPHRLELVQAYNRTTQTHTKPHHYVLDLKHLIHSTWTDRPPLDHFTAPFTAFTSSTLHSQSQHRNSVLHCFFWDLIQHPATSKPEEDKKIKIKNTTKNPTYTLYWFSSKNRTLKVLCPNFKPRGLSPSLCYV